MMLSDEECTSGPGTSGIPDVADRLRCFPSSSLSEAVLLAQSV